MDAVSTKNHLIEIIDNANTESEIIAATETILTILENTIGFWAELGYCYKGKEIAERMMFKLSEISDNENHHRLRRRLVKMVHEYQSIQNVVLER